MSPQEIQKPQFRPSGLSAVLSSGVGTVRVRRSGLSPATLTLRGLGWGHRRMT